MAETRHNVATLGWELISKSPDLQALFVLLSYIRSAGSFAPDPHRNLTDSLIAGIAIGLELSSNPDFLSQLNTALSADCRYERNAIHYALANKPQPSALGGSKSEATAAIIAMIQSTTK